jgi:hypothetical protein
MTAKTPPHFMRKRLRRPRPARNRNTKLRMVFVAMKKCAAGENLSRLEKISFFSGRNPSAE